MNALEKLRLLRNQDRSLRRWMKIVGLLIVAVAVYFYLQDFTRGIVIEGFLLFCALVGGITFVTGLLPGTRSDSFQREALSEYMHEKVREKETES